jgi:four helix bundle protein
MEDPHGLAEWAVTVPQVMRDDPMWRLPGYRFALFIGDLAQLEDAAHVRRDYRTCGHLAQWLDAVESISANIAEGYGRTSGRDRAKFYEYAESSAREARDWYFKVRHALDPAVALARIELISRIMRVLRTAIIRERREPESRARRASERHDAAHDGAPMRTRPATSTSDQRPASLR